MLYIKPEDHAAQKRDVHPSHRQAHITPITSPLYLVTVITNPQRYRTRYQHYRAFEKHMTDSGVILYTVELALRDRHFEITDSANPNHIQLRSESELWHKENLINVGISRIPANHHYAGYLDADFLMTRPDWVMETLHQLQHYQFVQLFSTYSDLGPDHSPSDSWPGFVKVFKDGGKSRKGNAYYDKGGLWGAPGGGWAWRREAFDKVGGLLDTCILGSADWHMAVALAQVKNPHDDLCMGSKGYIKSIQHWTERAKAIDKNIGYIENHALHSFHGKKVNRGYGTRTRILKKHNFDPYTDLSVDWQHVLRWNSNKPDLEEDVRQYFKARDEDSK